MNNETDSTSVPGEHLCLAASGYKQRIGPESSRDQQRGFMVKVAIIAQQRTGSTLLSSCLNAHTQVWCPPIELLLRTTWRGFVLGIRQSTEVLDDFYAKGLIRYETLKRLPMGQAVLESGEYQSLKLVRAAKIMHNQLLMTPRVDRYLVRDSDIRIIHLRRENLLKQHVSNMLNKRSKADRRPAQTTESLPVVTIRINPRYAVYRMRMARMLYQWYDKRLSHHPKVEMVYEQMVEANGLSASATDLLCGFLGVPPEPLGTKLVKLNPDDLRMIITNYAEVARVLAGTEFEQYLDERGFGAVKGSHA